MQVLTHSYFSCQILKTHQVPLEAFLVSLKFMQTDQEPDDEVDADEIACIVANLIADVSVHCNFLRINFLLLLSLVYFAENLIS